MSGTELRAFVGVGANLGDAQSTVRQALRALGGLAGCRLGACSSLYRTAPLQSQGPDFVNAVAELFATVDALALLRGLQDIEHSFGHVRSVRNAPRTLDLDLLLYGQKVLQTDELVLPHPRAHLRAFVLVPLAEIDATIVLPGRGALGPWLQCAAHQPIERIDLA